MNELLLTDDTRADAGALAERVILITGAGAGLGRACAEATAALGATVVLLDQAVAALETVYDAIETAGNPRPAIYPMDLLGATPSDHAELATRLEADLGGLNGLVHNAATMGKPAPMSQYDIETWYRTIQTNLHAPFLVTRYCLPLLQKRPASRLIGISDHGGRQGMAFYGAYGVAKWGLEGLLQTTAAELADDSPLRVASVDPGPLRTALRDEAYPTEAADRLARPEAVAGPLVRLLDPAFDVHQGGQYRVA